MFEIAPFRNGRLLQIALWPNISCRVHLQAKEFRTTKPLIVFGISTIARGSFENHSYLRHTLTSLRNHLKKGSFINYVNRTLALPTFILPFFFPNSQKIPVTTLALLTMALLGISIDGFQVLNKKTFKIELYLY